MVGQLDEGRIEDLRTWATSLATDGREELRAAGKAILMLIDEIDRLHVHARQMPDPGDSARIGRDTPAEQEAALEPASSQSLGASLRERLGVATKPRDIRTRP
jgi:hypothetical protein